MKRKRMKMKNNNTLRRIISILLAMIAALALSGCIFNTKPSSTPTPIVETKSSSPGKAGQKTEAASALAFTDTPTPSDTPTPRVISTAVIKIDKIDVYTGPGKTYPILAQVTYGEILRILGRNEQKTWLYVLIPDNRKGWILEKDLEEELDLDALPVILPTPTATPKTTEETPYGLGILVPPDLDGVTPAAARNPARKSLSMAATFILILLVFILNFRFLIQKRPAFKLSFTRILQIITSLL